MTSRLLRSLRQRHRFGGPLAWVARVALLIQLAGLATPARAQVQSVHMFSESEGAIELEGAPQMSNGGKVAFLGSRRVGGERIYGAYAGFAGGVNAIAEESSAVPGFEEISGVAISSNGTVGFRALARTPREDDPSRTNANGRVFTTNDPYENIWDADQGRGLAGINDDKEVVWGPNGLYFTGRPPSGTESSSSGYTVVEPYFLPQHDRYVPQAVINNQSQVACIVQPGGSSLLEVRRADIPGAGGPLEITTLASGFESIDSLDLDDSGRVVFIGWLPEGAQGIYASSGAGGVTALAISVENGPGFRGFGAVAVSAGGQIAFTANYTAPDGRSRSGIFKGFGGLSDKVAADGDPVTVDGFAGTLSVGGFWPRCVDDSGQVLFGGTVSPPDHDGGEGGGAGPASYRPSDHVPSRSGLFLTRGTPNPPDDEPPGDDEDDDPDNTHTWINDAGGAFATASNWSPAQVPVRNSERADSARFNLGAAYTVNTPEAATERLLVRGGDVTLNVGLYAVGASDPNTPSVSITRSGILRVTGGTLQSVNTAIGNGAITSDQVAEAHVFNTGTTWTNPGQMTIGRFTKGRLFVASGPTLTTGEARIGVDARGEAIVGGAGSFWDTESLAVGFAHEGTLAIESAGRVRAKRAHVGRSEGLGTLTVDGVGSRFTVTESPLDFAVGEGSGSGSLVVRGGGRVEATGTAHLAIGFGAEATGSVLVDGWDAAATARSTLSLGDGLLIVGWAQGTGTLWIDDGALLESGEADIGAVEGTGDIFVRGTMAAVPSRWENTGPIRIGPDSTGRLHVETGGLVVTEDLHVGSEASGNGLVEVGGVSTDDVPSRLRVTGGGIGSTVIGHHGGSGELRITGGARVDLESAAILEIGGDGGEGVVTVHGRSDSVLHRSTLELDRTHPEAGLIVVTHGSLEVAEGGHVLSRQGWVGLGGGTAHVAVSGADGAESSQWEIVDDLDLGYATSGSLHVVDGGWVSAAHLHAGHHPGGSATIHVRGVDETGFPSRLQITDSLLNCDLGYEGGRATLRIEEGGSMEVSGDGGMSLSSGEILVRGFAPGLVTPSRLQISGSGNGYLLLGGRGATLAIEDGAQVQCNVAVVGGIGTEPALVDVVGSVLGQLALWEIASELEVGKPAGSGSSGTVRVAADGAVTLGGATPVAGALQIGAGGTLRGQGTIVAPGGVGVTGGVNNFAGTVSPGTSPGTLTIEGNYTQGAAGVLEIEIGGLEAGYDFDVLAVTGAITFEPGAKIRVTFIDSNPDDAVAEIFVPRTGDVFNFLVAGAVALPAGATIGDLIEFSNLSAGVVLDLELEVVEGTTRVKATTTAAPVPATGWRITAHPRSVLVIAGSSKTFAVSVEDATGATYQWRRNGVDIAGATGASHTLPSPQPFHSGDRYSVVVTVGGTSVESRVASVAVAPAPASEARLINLSTRALGLSSDAVLIPGFVVTGSGTKRVLLRAVGPELTRLGVNGVMPDPRLRVVREGVEIASNDDWGTNANALEIAATAHALGAFELAVGGKDAALLLDLTPGAYTVPTEDGAGIAGIALVELYDADSAAGTASARVVNLSNRGYAGTGDEVMIPGFVISAEGPKTLLIRVVGPELARYHVDGVMEDPKLELYRRDPDTGGEELWFTQDNWSESPDAVRTAEVAETVGAFSLKEGGKDAAIVVTLAPGVYTAVGRGADGIGAGIVLVEIYVVE